MDECQYNISQPLLEEYFHQRLPAFTPSLSILLPQKFLRLNNDRYAAFCSHCMLIVNLYKVGNGARDWSREEDMVLLENGSNLAELRVDVTLEKRSTTEIEKRLERLNEIGEHFRQSALQRAFAVWLMHGVEVPPPRITNPSKPVGLTVVQCHNNPQATVRGTPPDELSLMMERYLSSSSEDEAAAIENIVEESIHYTNPVPQGDFENWRDPDEVVSSVDSTSSATSSATSLSSHCSHGSLQSRRKHNLRLHKRRVTVNPSRKQTQAQYQCTFCMADFSNSGNWSRHEHNIHLVAKHWVCAPDGIKESTNCLYCDGSPLSTLSDHTCTKTCLRTAKACSRKPIEERTFACKEHLKQHLKHSHGVSVWSQKFESWSKTVALLPQQARCGFCGEKFGNWNSRMKHIAREFRNGARMDSNWSGMWGLDQEWDLRVRQNGAILPHDRKNYPHDRKNYPKKARQPRRR